MCSINEEDLLLLENQFENDVTKSSKPTNCLKCNNAEIVINLKNLGSYCQQCFSIRAAHKFRSEFGKSKLIRDNEDVLVAFSGGKKSSAMIYLIQEGLSKRAQKKLRFHPTLIYIIDSLNWVSDKDQILKIIQMMKNSNASFFIYGLNQIYETTLKPLVYYLNTSTDNFPSEEEINRIIQLNCNLLNELQKTTKSKTSMDNLFNILKKNFLSSIAQSLNMNKILLGDSATSLAIKMVSNMAAGRGNQVPYEMNFADTSFKNTTFVKPLKSFFSEEIDLLMKINNIEYIEEFKKYDNPSKSIEELTKEFILGLQENNENTISIICRTGEKLAISAENSIEIYKICCLCKIPFTHKTKDSLEKLNVDLEEHNENFSLLDTKIQVNTNANACQNDNSITNDDCCGSKECCSNLKKEKLITKVDLLNCLCYGCQIIVNEMKEISHVIPLVQADAQKQINRNQMRLCIDEFLLLDTD